MTEVIDNVDIIKVGTNVLVNRQEDGSERFNPEMFASIGRQALGDNNVIIVSSAAITAGMIEDGLTERPDKETQMPELQRLSVIGWTEIVRLWKQTTVLGAAGRRKLFAPMLLTRQELGNREERTEALTVIHTLLRHRDIPLINENDAVKHEEIAFGDNDILAATLAAKIAQNKKLFGKHVRLFLLSDVNGVREDVDDPESRIPVIADTADYRHLIKDVDKRNSTGGMLSKFKAADIAKAAGVDMYIYNPADGHRERAVQIEIGTYFPAVVR